MTDHFVILAVEGHVGGNVNGDETTWFEVLDRGSQKAKIIVNVLNDVHKQHKIVGFEQCRISLQNVINEKTSFALCRQFQGALVKVASVYSEPQVSLEQLADNPVPTSDVECFLDGVPDSG